MTDDSTMEKKNYGFLTSKCPSGPLGQDCSRPRQDGSGGNQVVKNFSKSTPRRRDSPGSHQNAVKTRSETTPVRKPIPQKSKAMDKRPRARNVNNNQSVEESGLGPELGSLQTPGGKKQSLNHLLNFHFAPRENRSVFHGSWRSYNTHPGGGWRSRHGSGGGHLRPKFNKENFLQANCQFLVKSDGDYSAHLTNPDMLVGWENIEQIHIRVSGEFPNCPICLSPPVAAKMTRCGHIFCWPCLLHYLALSDKTCRKCPICFEPVYKHELKSVIVNNCEEIHVGDEVEMQLMVRKKGVFKAMPLMCRDRKAFEWEPIFSKLLEATPAEVKNRVLDRERRELEQRLEEEKHTPEVCFVEQAMRELDTRLSNTVESGCTDIGAKLSDVFGALNLPPIVDNEENIVDTEFVPCIPEAVEDHGVQQESLVGEAFIGRRRNESFGNDSVGTGGSDDDLTSPLPKHAGSEEYFYFYQGIKGENIFLHPINMAMLWKSFGPDPMTWPQMIQFRVIDCEYITMMEDMRKRLKFLQHLPLTTNVQLVEVELKPPVVTEAVLAEFSHRLEARKKRRHQRARDERRRERKLEEEERKRVRGPKFELAYDFPEYSFEEEAATSPQLNESDSIESTLNVSTTDEDNSSIDRNSNSEFGMSSSPPGRSFAQIVSQKTAFAAARKPMGAWGVAPKAEANLPSGTRFQSDSEADGDEYSVPTYRMSMSDAIARAIANVNTAGEDIEATTSASGGGGKKKGRRKGKVLFATGMGGLQ